MLRGEKRTPRVTSHSYVMSNPSAAVGFAQRSDGSARNHFIGGGKRAVCLEQKHVIKMTTATSAVRSDKPFLRDGAIKTLVAGAWPACSRMRRVSQCR